jgi:short/branched chain acyl-CoA dehydrogenase
MDLAIPAEFGEDLERFDAFLKAEVTPHLSVWNRQGTIPRRFFAAAGEAGWYGCAWEDGRMIKRPGLRETLLLERLSMVSPGVAVAMLIVSDLGLNALYHFGTEAQQRRFGRAAANGRTLICFGNTENVAGSDAAGIAMTAARADGGWVLNGAKAYTTNAAVSDLAVVTAVTDPAAERSRRTSMFLADLTAGGVRRRTLNKQVWIPSDLTRIEFADVFVPDDALMGERGRGLPQTLAVFTRSRVPIAGIAIGTAAGAFELALQRARRRKVFGRPLVEFQAKAFEAADFHARLEAARLMVYRAATAMDDGGDFRLEAAMAKYLAVGIAREIGPWAADLFGAASVMFDHPVHKFPMDAWAASLAEGTQDVQKLVIFRELLKRGTER